MVIEPPAGAYGMIDDFWLRPISEIGPLDPDKAKSGEFMGLPPDYTGEKPAEGYYVVQSTTNQVFYMVRGLVHDGNVQGAVDSLRTIMIYPYAKRDNPPMQKVIEINKQANCDSFARPLFDILRPVPGLAWIPVMIILFGIGPLSKAIVIFQAVLVACIISAYSGIKQTKDVHMWVG